MNMSSKSARALALSLAITLSIPSTMAFADSSAAAAEYYQQAAESYGEGEFQVAAELLERAFALDHNLVYKYNQILAYQGMKSFVEALRVLDIYETPMKADGRFDDLDQIRADLEEAIAIQETEAAQAKEASEPEEVVEPVPEPVEPLVTEPQESGSNVLAWSLIGAGGVALLGAGITGSGILIGDELARLDANTYSERELYDQDVSTLSTHQTMTVVFLASGVVLAGTGAVLLLMGDSDADVDSRPTLSFAPYFSPQSAGMMLNVGY